MLAPVLRHLLFNDFSQDLTTLPSDELAEALIALSKFGPAKERFDAIALAEGLTQLCDHLLVAIASRKSVLIRLEGRISESLSHIWSTMAKDCFPYCDNQTKELYSPFDRQHSRNKRHYAECGSLLTSLVECYLQLGEFKNAEDYVFLWPTPMALSPLEVYIMRSKTLVVARMYRWKGDFETAGKNIEYCLSFMSRMDSNRPQILAQKVGVLCELDGKSNAKEILQRDLETWKSNRPFSKGLRRLQVSYLETMTILGSYEEASTALEPLLEHYRHYQKPDVVDDVLMVRIWVYRALLRHLQSLESRTSHEEWKNVEDTWLEARDRIQSSRVFGPPGFTHCFVELWILDTQRRQAVSQDAAPPAGAIDEAKRLREHYITGLGTFWLDKVTELLALPARRQ